MLSIPGFSDPVSSLTHLTAAVVFAILGPFLVARGSGGALRVISLAVFAFSCVLLLSLSGVYHLLTPETAARGVRFVLPLVWGALAYTFGAVAEFLGWPVLVAGVVGPHEIFHLAVVAGISFHWAFIRGIAAGGRTGALDAQVAVLNLGVR
jgi:predicted membrane channel-forming protein YqfA (hemolysin III family)